MKTLIKKSILNNKTIKICSLILGYCVWAFLAKHANIDQWKNVPVCFYNADGSLNVTSSVSTIKVHLYGKREDLKLCKDMAFHINAQSLADGENILYPTGEQLFLPSSVKLVNYTPLTILVNKEKNKVPLLN
jgi:hypothetical protein